MTTETHIGLQPFAQAEAPPPVHLTRRVIFWPITTLKLIGDHKLLLNINHTITSQYETDLEAYEAWLLSINLAEINPRVIAIENEETYPYNPPKSIVDYCKLLECAVETLPNYKITNGGFTLALNYWYYKQNPSDTEFFDKCIPDPSKQPLLNGTLAPLIERVQYELVALKGLKIACVNYHYYLWQAGQVEPLVRMIEFVKEYVGKPVISNESGIYTAGLLNDVISIARCTGMRFLILYSGGELCLNISKEEFQQATG